MKTQIKKSIIWIVNKNEALICLWAIHLLFSLKWLWKRICFERCRYLQEFFSWMENINKETKKLYLWLRHGRNTTKQHNKFDQIKSTLSIISS
jgi:hypothetical protein